MATHAVIPADVPALARLQNQGLILGVVGVGAGLVGFVTNRDQFFQSWLIGFLFCLGLSLGSLGLLMLQHLSGGQWGLVGRRVFEASARTLPLVALFFVPILFAMPTLFLWARPEVVAGDAILQAKAPYLNVKFFIARAVVFFAFWNICAWLLSKWSGAQDRGEESIDPAGMVRFRALSAPGILFLVLTLTFAMTDWVMSLDPHWFSTIFGLMFTSGFGLSAFAFTILVLAIVGPTAELAGRLRPGHFHDLGKLLLAFTMLWAYLNFSQFLIIWSGNLPEEIPWYLERIRGGWGYVALALVFGHFALPFVLLLSQDLKKNSRRLARVAIFILVMRLVDIIWLVAPTFGHHGFPIHWMDVALPVGLVGIWLFMFTRNLRSRALMPLNDPFFKEAFAHDLHHARHGHSEHDGLYNEDVAHEDVDVNIRQLLGYTIALVVLSLVSALIVYGVFRTFEKQAEKADPVLSPHAVPAGQQPPEPRLVYSEPTVLRKQRSIEAEALETYGWVDQAAGVARVPIEEAKQLLLQRGLPVRADAPTDPWLGTYSPARGESSSGRNIPVRPEHKGGS